MLDNTVMKTYKRHRFPSEMISYAVWLYFRFNLSHRVDVFLQSKRDGIAAKCFFKRLLKAHNGE